MNTFTNCVTHNTDHLAVDEICTRAQKIFAASKSSNAQTTIKWILVCLLAQLMSRKSNQSKQCIIDIRTLRKVSKMITINSVRCVSKRL